MSKARRALTLAAILLAGLALKGALLSTSAVSFDSDEAVVALMAKHILAGERPVFFYGQTYMGSLDAYLIAGAFQLFGSSVFSVRLVQAFLFAGLILVTYLLVRRLYADETTALVTALLVAIPTPLVSLYTTITLGGYVEMLLLGTCLLLLGHVVTERAGASRDGWRSWLAWALLGLLAGLGFWTLPLSVIYLVPVALVVLRHWKWRLGPRYGLAVAAFVVGSSPWWGFCLGHGDACLKPLTDSPAQLLTPAGWLATLGYRLFNLVLLGLPSLWGLRNPWSAEYRLSLLAIPVLALYLGSLAYALRVRSRNRFLPVAMAGTFVLVFLLTPFGNDGTGRYLLPLYLPAALLVAELIRALKVPSPWLAAAGLACLLAFNLAANVEAALSEPAGMTAQLDARLQFGNRYDSELIDFLTRNGETYGYSHYWVAYKITFLSDETIMIAPRLSYKVDLSYDTGQDRYPIYSMRVDDSEKPPFYVISNQPELEERLRQALDARQIGYREQVIGGYRVFYDLSGRAAPEELGLHEP